MELTLDEMRLASLTTIQRHFADKKPVAALTVGALVTVGTSYSRIEITDDELEQNKDRLERFVSDRCETAEIQTTGHISRA